MLTDPRSHFALRDADSKFIEGYGDMRRPSDFYVIKYEADPSVCRAILLSLNKEYRTSDDKLDDESMESDSLLGAELE
jgi:hypothetical protein